MTSILERPTSPAEQNAQVEGPAQSADARRLGRLSSWLRAHGRSLTWLTPVVALSALVQAINMGGSPQRIDDEGTYVAQAFAVDKLGELAHYTFWYDHPPLGWLQIAAYTKLTNAFDRVDVAVLAGREATLLATMISVVLVWLLARRLHLSRPASAAAALIFAVSPLAVQFHRTVYLDNIATPWLLGAFLLAMSRRHQLAGFAASAATMGIAVLTKETYLLALPFLVWVMVRHANPAIRRYSLSVAASVLVLVGGSYIVFAAVKNELFPGDNRVSLIDGIAFQLAARASSGSVFDPDSLMNATFAIWTQLDPVFIVTGILASIAGIFFRRLRPLAVMMVFLLAFIFRPGGYLPVPYVIMLLPFAALLIAGVTDLFVRSWRKRIASTRAPAIAWTATMAAAALVAVPVWGVQLRGLLLADLDQPTRAAEGWIIDNVPKDNRLIVDDAMWVELVTAGFARDNVIWYYKINTDPAVEALSPDGWRDSDYIVTTDSMRTFPDTFPDVRDAIENSVIVASFGSGTQQVDVREILPMGIDQAAENRELAIQGRAAAGSDLVTNPNLTVTGDAGGLLQAGRVDSRILLALGQQLASTEFTIGGFPAIPGEDDGLRRQVLITGIDGRSTLDDADAATTVAGWLNTLSGTFEVSAVQTTPDGVLATFSVDEPRSIIPIPAG